MGQTIGYLFFLILKQATLHDCLQIDRYLPMQKMTCFSLILISLLVSCNHDDDPSPSTGERTFHWSGYTWIAKDSDNKYVGPGANRFSDSTANVWIDDDGYLHLKISNINGRYTCAEVYTKETVSYGTYVFRLKSRIDQLDKNVVLGLFTWNDSSCYTNTNSEIDIEFAKWGNAKNPNSLVFSVQPTDGGNYVERTHSFPISLKQNRSYYSFSWTPDKITWAAFQGLYDPPPFSDLIAGWEYDTTNQQNVPRGGSWCNSLPIKIPEPEVNTRIHINLWLFDANNNGYGDVPSDGNEVEIIIQEVIYLPV